MIVNTFKTILRHTALITFPFTRLLTYRKLNTQVFSQLPYNKLADPQFTKALIRQPIHRHSRVSQTSLFHRKRVGSRILTCFSEKKHKVYRKINKTKRTFYSQVLGQNVNVTLSAKAHKTIKKMGSFDNYILCTKPYDLDSRYGQYLRELMLRKINNQDFHIPYILGTNKKIRTKKYQRHLYLKDVRKIPIPKQFKQNYRTFQRAFGKTPEQLTNQDYAKYVQLQNLKKTLGDQLQPTHPLIKQLKQKLNNSIFTEEQQKKFDDMALQAEQQYVNDPRYGVTNRKRVQKTKQKVQIMDLKLAQMRFKLAQ